MASGSYARKSLPQEPIELEKRIPARATRELPPPPQEPEDEDEEFSTGNSFTRPIYSRDRTTRVVPTPQSMQTTMRTSSPARTRRIPTNEYAPTPAPLPRRIVSEYAPTPAPLQRHQFWLRPWVICVFCVVASLLVLISAGIFQRSDEERLLNYGGGKSYDIQVGGKLASTWQSDEPLQPKVPIKPQSGPYVVLGKPTITPNFINQVLSAYHSPAAGKGQSLYDLGVKYGIDPAFALAFFMHESTFGTKGEASGSLSLGNIRCIPNFRCRDNFAWFDTWEDGFQEWYKLMRNLYVAQWGLTTVDQIIPTYAPAADHNDESAYINSLKHSLDTWHAGQIFVR